MTGLGPTREATNWNKRSCGWAQTSRWGFATEGEVVEGNGETLPQLAFKGGVVLTGADLRSPSDRARRWIRKQVAV